MYVRERETERALSLRRLRARRLRDMHRDFEGLRQHDRTPAGDDEPAICYYRI